MNQFEILSMYLPYNILVNTPNDLVFTKTPTQQTLLSIETTGVSNCKSKNGFEVFLTGSLKPILYDRDLTQPIWHNGKEIVPIVELLCLKYSNHNLAIKDNYKITTQNGKLKCIEIGFGRSISIDLNDVDKIPFYIIQYCLERRINIWLKEGEYIPVTNEFNPYK